MTKKYRISAVYRVLYGFEVSKTRYYFEVPLSELGGDKNKIDINVFAKSRVAKTFGNPSTTKFEYSSETTSTYIVQKRGLFDLD